MSVETDRQTVRAISQTVAAEVLGFRSSGSLRALRGAPRGRDGRYDLTQLVPWFLSRHSAGPTADGDDAAMAASPDCPHAIRWRKERADQMEIKTLAMRNEVIRIETLHTTHDQLAATLRRIGDQLGYRFGPEARQIVDDAVDVLLRLQQTWAADLAAGKACFACFRPWGDECLACLSRSTPDDQTKETAVDTVATRNDSHPSVVPSAAGPQADEEPAEPTKG
jgi:phage terminase Nu1 subunit (DNA packaging protein)